MGPDYVDFNFACNTTKIIVEFTDISLFYVEKMLLPPLYYYYYFTIYSILVTMLQGLVQKTHLVLSWDLSYNNFTKIFVVFVISMRVTFLKEELKIFHVIKF